MSWKLLGKRQWHLPERHNASSVFNPDTPIQLFFGYTPQALRTINTLDLSFWVFLSRGLAMARYDAHLRTAGCRCWWLAVQQSVISLTYLQWTVFTAEPSSQCCTSSNAPLNISTYIAVGLGVKVYTMLDVHHGNLGQRYPEFSLSTRQLQCK